MLGLIMTSLALVSLIVCVFSLWRLDKMYNETHEHAVSTEVKNIDLSIQLERHKHLVEGLQDELDKTDDIEISVQRIRNALTRIRK